MPEENEAESTEDGMPVGDLPTVEEEEGFEAMVPLTKRHLKALLAFGETAFGPMELDDDHDEALTILREHYEKTFVGDSDV